MRDAAAGDRGADVHLQRLLGVGTEGAAGRLEHVLRVRRVGDHGLGQVWTPDRLALGRTRLKHRFVELESELVECFGHRRRTSLAVLAVILEPPPEDRIAGIDCIAEDVKVALVAVEG